LSASPPPPPTHSDQDILEASKWGRVDADGTVYVKDGSTERPIGQFPGVPSEEALALYARRFLDLRAQVDLFNTRLDSLSQKEIDSTLSQLKQALAEPAAVGDLDGLREFYRATKAHAAEVRKRLEAERLAVKEQALQDRIALVEQAEELADAESGQVNWKQAGIQLRETLETWKNAQRSGPRIDRAVEDELWKRFSHARTTFDRKRRTFFAELDKRQGTAKATKERIAQEAEKLATSTDWGQTSKAYRDLMDEWREAGRTNRRDDDALWARFRGAQDQFFQARDAHHAASDAERLSNLQAKLEVIEQAETLLPIKDLAAAKAKLRELEDRWDGIGHVPRRDIDRVEGRMKAVADQVRTAEEAAWRKTNPETQARADSMTSQLEALIEGLKRKLTKVEATGNQAAIDALRSDIAGREQMLEQIKASAERGWA